MTSSVHGLSDNSVADEQHKYIESQIQSESPTNGTSHHGTASPTMHYTTPAQLGVGNGMQRHGMFQAQTVYPYPDPYYRSIFAPCDTQPYTSQPSCDTQPYTSQPYAPQPMVQLQLLGIQQAGLPLPSDAVEEPIFVNAKQYHGILRRRQSRARAEENKTGKSQKPYLHESRHLHALKRARGLGGRFQRKSEKQQKEAEASDKSQPSINLNREKNDP